MDLKLLIEKTAEGLGFEVIDIESSPRGRLLRVFIDKPEGINVDTSANQTIKHRGYYVVYIKD